MSPYFHRRFLMANKRTIEDLHYFQSLPLNSKIAITKDRIREWYNYFGGKIYVSFSGGKDSTVLLHIAREMYPDVKAVFVNTGLEYPEVVKFVQTVENVETIRPKKTFIQIIEESGYPLFSKEISESITGGVKYLNELVKREIAGNDDRSEIANAPYMADFAAIDRRGGLKMNNPACIALKQCAIPSEILLFQPPDVLNAIEYDGHDIEVELSDESKKLPKASRYSRENYKFALFAPFNISKRCCRVLKKSPVHIYWSKTKCAPMTAQTASESAVRAMQWLHNGCNLYDGEFPISNPMSFWTEQDVLLYIYEKKLQIADVYGEVVKDTQASQDESDSLFDLGIFDKERPSFHTTGCDRTGCFACLFGAHLEKENNSRFCNLRDNSNPKILDWMLRGGEFRESDGKWHPKNGLGYWFIMEWCNKFGGMKFWYPNRDYYISEYSTEETDYWLNNPKFDENENVMKTLLQDMKEAMSRSK